MRFMFDFHIKLLFSMNKSSKSEKMLLKVSGQNTTNQNTRPRRQNTKSQITTGDMPFWSVLLPTNYLRKSRCLRQNQAYRLITIIIGQYLNQYMNQSTI